MQQQQYVLELHFLSPDNSFAVVVQAEAALPSAQRGPAVYNGKPGGTELCENIKHIFIIPLQDFNQQ
jgi:hypothetical protein